MKENSCRLMDFSMSSLQIRAKQTKTVLELTVLKGLNFALCKSCLRICVK